MLLLSDENSIEVLKDGGIAVLSQSLQELFPRLSEVRFGRLTQDLKRVGIV